MLIDCRTCVARDVACDDCVVNVLLNTPPPVASARAAPTTELDDESRVALEHLAAAGLVPPLRLVRPTVAPDRAAGRDIA